AVAAAQGSSWAIVSARALAWSPTPARVSEPMPVVAGLHLVGYGATTGIGSDTLAGVGDHAKALAETIAQELP
ncbi:MAG TPA: hypothetical protein VFC72_04280, partial [Corynebacterium sp.]|nr:hypothetical protein [Corynebacterium sp.]